MARAAGGWPPRAAYSALGPAPLLGSTWSGGGVRDMRMGFGGFDASVQRVVSQRRGPGTGPRPLAQDCTWG